MILSELAKYGMTRSIARCFCDSWAFCLAVCGRAPVLTVPREVRVQGRYASIAAAPNDYNDITAGVAVWTRIHSPCKCVSAVGWSKTNVLDSTWVGFPYQRDCGVPPRKTLFRKQTTLPPAVTADEMYHYRIRCLDSGVRRSEHITPVVEDIGPTLATCHSFIV